MHVSALRHLKIISYHPYAHPSHPPLVFPLISIESGQFRWKSMRRLHPERELKPGKPAKGGLFTKHPKKLARRPEGGNH